MFYARARVIRAQSDDKDTAKTVNFNVLIFFFRKISDFSLYLCWADGVADGGGAPKKENYKTKIV